MPDHPRLLILRIGALGDVLHALPAVAALRQLLPTAHIGWAVDPRWASLLAAHTGQGTRLVDAIHPIPTQAWKSDPLSLATARSIRALRRELLAPAYNIAVDLQGTIRSSIVGRLASAPVFAGPANPREPLAALLYNLTVAPTQPHVVQQACEILGSAFGLDLQPAPLTLDPDSAADRWCDYQLSAFTPGERSRLVALAAGGGWGAKCWPTDRFGALAVALAERGFVPLITAATPDNPLALEVVRASSGTAKLVVCDIPRLAALLRRSALCIAGDTGPLHLAAALGIPVLGIYGPTDPARNGPFTPLSRVLRNPASLTSHRRRHQPEAGLLGISVKDVINSAMELLT